MQFYRRNLPHLQKDDTAHFIRFVTKSRWILPPPARDIVLSACRHDHRRKCELYVVVVMPDHVHLILTPLINEQRRAIHPLTQISQSIKGASGRAINQRLRREGPVWQEESFDHVLRSSEGLDAKGLRLAEPDAQGIGHELDGLSVGVAETRSARSRDESSGKQHVAPDAFVRSCARNAQCSRLAA
jgi:REP element-mobilizing transposase RayT